MSRGDVDLARLNAQVKHALYARGTMPIRSAVMAWLQPRLHHVREWQLATTVYRWTFGGNDGTDATA